MLYINKSIRPREAKANKNLRTKEPGPRAASSAYEHVYPSNFGTHEHEKSSHTPENYSFSDCHLQNTFHPGLMYPGLAQPIPDLDIPSYQLPSYLENRGISPPFSSKISKQHYIEESLPIFPWWLAGQNLCENNNMYPTSAEHEIYSPVWDMHQESSYLPPGYYKPNNYPTSRASLPRTSTHSSSFLPNQCTPPQTMHGTNTNLSQLLPHLPSRPQTAAPFIYTKDPTHNQILSRVAKDQLTVSIKQENDRNSKDPNGQHLRNTSSANQHKRTNTNKPQEHINYFHDDSKYVHQEKVYDYTKHKAGTYEPNRNNPPGVHKIGKKSEKPNPPASGDRPHPLTREALDKLNKEHGDDVDSKLPGVCRANSSRSTIFDKSDITTGKKATRSKS